VNDFAPISLLFTSPYALFARKTMPAKELNELVAWLKANPNKASAGITGSSFRLITAFFQKETGTQFTLVPYRGGAPALQDLVAGQIDLLFMNLDALPLVRAGSTIRSAPASSTAWRGQAAMQPGLCRMNSAPARNGWSCSSRSHPA
jgi:tripartite-type tricarboxylate transporter receptor subunit TctC